MRGIMPPVPALADTYASAAEDWALGLRLRKPSSNKQRQHPETMKIIKGNRYAPNEHKRSPHLNPRSNTRAPKRTRFQTQRPNLAPRNTRQTLHRHQKRCFTTYSCSFRREFTFVGRWHWRWNWGDPGPSQESYRFARGHAEADAIMFEKRPAREH